MASATSNDFGVTWTDLNKTLVRRARLSRDDPRSTADLLASPLLDLSGRQRSTTPAASLTAPSSRMVTMATPRSFTPPSTRMALSAPPSRRWKVSRRRVLPTPRTAAPRGSSCRLGQEGIPSFTSGRCRTSVSCSGCSARLRRRWSNAIHAFPQRAFETHTSFARRNSLACSPQPAASRTPSSRSRAACGARARRSFCTAKTRKRARCFTGTTLA